MAIRRKRHTRRRKGYLGVFLLFCALYLSQTSPWSVAEFVAAGIGAALITALLLGMSEAVETCFSLKASWFTTLGRLLLTRTPKDCLLVLLSLGKRRSGQVCAPPFLREAFGDKALDAGHRAMAVTGVSVGPNTIVIDVDPDRDRLIVHQLVSTGSPPGGGNQLWPIEP